MTESVAQSERRGICDLMEAEGPLAPTLCEGWVTSDLAAHLYVREAKPLASPGILIPAFAAVTQSAMDQAKADLGFAGLIAKIRTGPPLPLRLVDAQVNAIEYFVHHEDVRRAQAVWEPRVDPALDTFCWARARLGARLLSRRLKAGLELSAPGYGSVTARPGGGLSVSGGPQELMLLLFGRMKAARLEIDGSEAAEAALRSTSFGI